MSKDQPWTLGRLLEWTAAHLKEKGAEFPRLDAEVLLAYALNDSRIHLYTRYEEEATPETRAKFKELVQERIKGCPVAYLVGRKEFYSLELEVTRDVLIPRPDTECVVDAFLRLARGMNEPAVVDVGTGSGCIAAAVAKRRQDARVTAVDLSPAALEVARRNAEKHCVAARVRFLHGDLFAPLPDGERFDFVLSNPPYIPHGDIAALPIGVRDFEPHIALDGGADGFAVFDRLISAAAERLKPTGWLVVEIGAPQEAGARSRLEGQGGYALEKTILDAAGHPRVLTGRRR
jgi:release factor glutamine methyltransferase